MSLSRLWIAILFVFISGIAVWASEQGSAASGHETHINAQTGQSFRIVLPSNPSTGYSWVVDFDKNFLKLEKSRYMRPSQQIPGRGGRHLFIFTPLKAGETTLELNYKRPWEASPVETQKYSISISESL